MTDDLRVLLHDAADEPVGPPDVDNLWEQGSSRRRRRSAVRVAVLALPLLFLVAAVSQFGGLSGDQNVATDIAAPTETTTSDSAVGPTKATFPSDTAAPVSASSASEPQADSGIRVEAMQVLFPMGPFLSGAAIVALAALALGQMLRVSWKAALAAIIVGALVAAATVSWYGRSERASAVEVVTERAERNRDTVEALLGPSSTGEDPRTDWDRVEALESTQMGPNGGQPIVRFDSEWLNLRPFELEWRDIPVELRTEVQAGSPSSMILEIKGEKRLIVRLPFKNTPSDSYYEVVSLHEQDRVVRNLSLALGLTVPFAGLIAFLVTKMRDPYSDRRRKGPKTQGVIPLG